MLRCGSLFKIGVGWCKTIRNQVGHHVRSRSFTTGETMYPSSMSIDAGTRSPFQVPGIDADDSVAHFIVVWLCWFWHSFVWHFPRDLTMNHFIFLCLVPFFASFWWRFFGLTSKTASWFQQRTTDYDSVWFAIIFGICLQKKEKRHANDGPTTSWC